MYRNFSLTDSERKEIMEQHKQYGYRKPLNEQDAWATKAATNPEKCDLDKLSRSSNDSRELKAWDKEVNKQGKIDAKQSEQELKDYLNPRIDRLGDKIDKKDFNTRYANFVKSNPGFESEQSTLTPEQRFGILYKEEGALKNNVYYLNNKLNKMFNHTGPIDMQTFYEFIKKMGGFDKYFEQYKTGFTN